MKYHEISPLPKLTVRRASVAAMLEDGGLLERLEAAGWVAPIKRATKKGESDLFSVEQLQAAIRKMERNQLA